MSFSPKLYSHDKNSIKVELYMSNYATKSDLKSAARINTSKCAKKADLTGLKSSVKKIDIDTLATTPVDLSKRRNVVKMMLLKTLSKMNRLKKLMIFRLSILVI